jgi:hypothetical protein
VKARACGGHRTLALPWRKVDKQQFTDIHPVQQLGFRGRQAACERKCISRRGLRQNELCVRTCGQALDIAGLRTGGSAPSTRSSRASLSSSKRSTHTASAPMHAK